LEKQRKGKDLANSWLLNVAGPRYICM
jgi:hypothetical protein